MISIPAGVHIYLACGHTDMRRDFDDLALMAQEVLAQNPYAGALFIFRGKRGDCVFAKWLENGRFVWPLAATGNLSLTAARPSTLLLDGIDGELSALSFFFLVSWQTAAEKTRARPALAGTDRPARVWDR
jgi:transposase